MLMMASHMLKFEHSSKTQKSEYFENERFFFVMKKFIHYTLITVIWQKIIFLWKLHLSEIFLSGYSLIISIRILYLTFNFKNYKRGNMVKCNINLYKIFLYSLP